MTIDVMNHIVFLMIKVTCVAGPLLVFMERGLDTSSASAHRWLALAFIGLALIPLISFVGPQVPLPVLQSSFNQEVVWPWQAQNLSQALLWGFLVLYLAGVGTALLKLAFGHWQLWRLSHLATLVVNPRLCNVVQQARHELHIKRQVQLVVHPEIQVPITWGVLKPVVGLPAAACKWPTPLLRRVILHEAAHIQRLDVLVHGVLGFMSAWLWCLPLRAKLFKRLNWHRELACDDAVLSCGIDKAEYAQDLLRFAKPPSLRWQSAMSLMELSALYCRINAILNDTRPDKNETTGWRLPLMMVLCFFGGVGALTLQPKTLGEGTTQWIIEYPFPKQDSVLEPGLKTVMLEKPKKPTNVATSVATGAHHWETALGAGTLDLKAMDLSIELLEPEPALDPTVAPVKLQFEWPQYPPVALRRGYEGEVEVTFDILPNGRVDNIRLSLAHAKAILNEAVINAVKTAVYTPQLINGQPTKALGVKEHFQFQIREDAN